MFDVLMYLFETYIHNEAEMRVDQDKLTRDLTDAGFEREDIYNALMWLEKLADYQEGLVAPMQLASDPLSLRVYTDSFACLGKSRLKIRGRIAMIDNLNKLLGQVQTYLA